MKKLNYKISKQKNAFFYTTCDFDWPLGINAISDCLFQQLNNMYYLSFS